MENFFRTSSPRVATNHSPQNSLTFPDFSLTFYSFPYPFTDQKTFFILYFNGANCITSTLGVTLKRKNLLPKGANSFLLRVAPNEEGDEKVHCFPP